MSNTKQPRFLSSATKATLARSRKAKELLQQSADTTQEEMDNTASSNFQESQDSQEDQINHNKSSDDEDSEISDNGGRSETSPVPKSLTTDKVIEANQAQEKQVNSTHEEDSAPTDQNSKQQKVGPVLCNPYKRNKPRPQQGILHAIPQGPPSHKHQSSAGSIDKQIILKKGMLRPHIHRYTLRIKIISSKSEEDEQVLVQKTLKKVL